MLHAVRTAFVRPNGLVGKLWIVGDLLALACFQADGGALLTNVEERGKQLRSGLEALKEKYPEVIDGESSR